MLQFPEYLGPRRSTAQALKTYKLYADGILSQLTSVSVQIENETAAPVLYKHIVSEMVKDGSLTMGLLHRYTAAADRASC